MIVPVGTDGKVRIFNNYGSTHVVVDVVGYMRSGTDAATRDGRVVPLTSPYRTFDTRERRVRRSAARAGPGRGLELRRLRRLGQLDRRLGRQPARRDRQPHVGIAHPPVPDGPVAGRSSRCTRALPRPLSSNLNMIEGPRRPNMAI